MTPTGKFPNPEQEALRRIAECKFFSLDLGELGLGEISEPVAKGISQLPELTVLRLAFNQLDGVSDAFSAALAKLAKLRVLNMVACKIGPPPEAFSKAIGNLTDLTTLALGGNDFGGLPATLIDSIGKLPHIETIYLNGNQLSELPEEFSKALGNLTTLHDLHLANNKLKELPDHFVEVINKLPELKRIDLDGNPLPDEILAASGRGIEDLRSYLNQARAHPRTVKVMLLGEPETGKSTLVRALQGNPRPCDNPPPETQGVVVTTVPKTHPQDGKQMFLACWDFAGQHMEHATHQFFLTENAVYLVLWRAREGTEGGRRDLYYWLELLKMRVKDAKFILVETRAKTRATLNYADLREAYPGFQEHFAVELSDLSGFGDMEKKLLQLAGESPSLKVGWPPAWLKVRDAVRERRKTDAHIDLEAFRALVASHGVTAETAQDSLGDQLDSLGEIVWKKENEELRNFVVLDPTWLTSNIAGIIRDPDVRVRQGRLLNSDLQRIWGNLTPAVRDHLVRLMDEFDLAYPTDDPKETGIVVQALHPAPEEQRTFAGNGAQMEMIFRFPTLQRHLPPGVPAWAFARAHRYLAQDQGPWSDAAFFEDASTVSRAMILASDLTREVRLRVAGDYPPYFFGYLKAVLEDTFKRYPGAQPEYRLPCPCSKGCNQTYLLSTVLKRNSDRKSEISCGQTGADVSIERLLSGFTPPESPQGQAAFQREVLGILSAIQNGINQRLVKTCPWLFTLWPAKGFTQLASWIESVTRSDEMELTLYCEFELKPHPTAQSVYRFRSDRPEFAFAKDRWGSLAEFTKRIAPVLGIVGGPLAAVPAIVEGIGKITGDLTKDPTGSLTGVLAQSEDAISADLNTGPILERLLATLDAARSSTQLKNGGLFSYQRRETGRLVWLCKEHHDLYTTDRR